MNTFTAGLWRPALCALIVAGAALTAGFGTAHSAFPGLNGVVVVASKSPPEFVAHIYSITPEGTGRSDLSQSTAGDERPTWSPDGSLVAFVRNGSTVMVMRPDGSAQRTVGTGRDPAWAPDGSQIAVARDGDVWAIHVDGGREEQLTSTPDHDGGPVWSPDGGRIAFRRQGDGQLSLVTVDYAGRDERIVGPLGGGWSYVWSHDGAVLFYVDNGGVSRAELSSGVTSVVARMPSLTLLDLSPDGRTLVATKSLGDRAELHTVDLASGRVRRLIASGGCRDDFPAWSPDGSRIAFARDCDQRLHIVRADGSGERVLPREHPNTAFAALDWSPDGTRLLFASAFQDDTELFTLRDGQPRQLTRNWAEDVDPAWSPDGQQIAFARRPAVGSWDVWVMNADGTAQRRLTKDPAQDGDPAWSPDGSRIVYFSSGHLSVMRADGTRQGQLTSGFDPAWSPDGSRILFARHDDPPVLTTIRPDGTGRRELCATGDTVCDPEEHVTGYEPDWSPDGRRFVFDREYYAEGDPYWAPSGGVTVAAASGELLTEIAFTFGGVWSPDGKLVLVGGHTLFTPDGAPVAKISELSGAASWQPRCSIGGTSRRDILLGTPARDLVCGLGGDDAIAGGSGRDRLFGGRGDDRIDARDRAFDVVGCGPGVDTVLADGRDLVGVDCEGVTR